MTDLKAMNIIIYDKFKKLKDANLSAPLLVSSNRYLHSLTKHPIMYIGQETNGWVNYDDGHMDFDKIEDTYDNFLIDYHTSKSLFWSFLKKATGLSYEEFSKQIIWCNTLIAGKKDAIGTPNITNELKDISLEYLLFLYNYFKPLYVIDVSGPNNPYYDVTTKFLDTIGSNISTSYPSKENYILMDDIKNIVWTYHPKKINMDQKTGEVTDKILEKIRKY